MAYEHSRETSRRRYLAITGVVGSGALAGCLGGDGGGLSDEEFDDVETWIDDSFQFNRIARTDLQIWLEAPDERGLERFSQIESDAADLLATWDDDIDPLREGIEETTVNRTVQDETTTVEGEDLLDAMEELQRSIADIETSANIIVDADGDPDSVANDERTTIEESIDGSSGAEETINELWYQGQA